MVQGQLKVLLVRGAEENLQAENPPKKQPRRNQEVLNVQQHVKHLLVDVLPFLEADVSNEVKWVSVWYPLYTLKNNEIHKFRDIKRQKVRTNGKRTEFTKKRR